MASIHRQPGRPNYFASFRAKGRQHFLSTGIPHTPEDPAQIEPYKTRAQAKADQMEREARAKVLMPNLSIRKFLEEFAATRSADPDTARRTASVVSRFLSIPGDKDQETLTAVSPLHILRYLELRGGN
jgi:hypothetical protein